MINKVIDRLKETLEEKEDSKLLTEHKDETVLTQSKIYSEEIQTEIDCIITIGGDGTVLHAIKLYYNCDLPPLITFNMGTLGYLWEFMPEDVENVLENWFLYSTKNIYENIGGTESSEKLLVDRTDKDTELSVIERARLCVEVQKSDNSKFEAISHVFSQGKREFKPLSSFLYLNEIRVESGLLGNNCTLEIYLNHHLLTTYEGHGIIVSTPTGSTSYNLSAGGCAVTTRVPWTCINAINPKSLAFRPLIVPSDTLITIKAKETEEMSEYKAFIDGGFKFDIKANDILSIQNARSPAKFITQKSGDPVVTWLENYQRLFD